MTKRSKVKVGDRLEVDYCIQIGHMRYDIWVWRIVSYRGEQTITNALTYPSPELALKDALKYIDEKK